MTESRARTGRREPLVRAADAAEYLDVSERTLTNWRWRGIGPRFIKMEGGRIRYRQNDLDAWLDDQSGQVAS